ncbi:alpha/beta fold hydrolase [Pseudonocardia sp. N23]|uniref:alpha/beta fold hydrolase n=1 Tax=Pseudonocardia sp. N23 TaxID=1987376 RepID=UPI001559506E|nr:alpha/beta hydrolase [Pseudonocardia sp. N23]
MSDAGRTPGSTSAPDPSRPVPPLADPAAFPPLDLTRRPWAGRQVTAGGVTLHVRETPGAPARAVYVHGLSGSATNWTDLAGLLAGRAAGTSVDLPGFGLSPPLEPRVWTPDANADALARFLRASGDEPVHLLGNSLGGTVCVLLAARHPDLVRTLTLVSPAVPDRRPDPRRLSDPRLALAMVPGSPGRRARAALAAMGPRERAEQVLTLCFGDPSRAPEHRIVEAAEEIVARGAMPWAGEAVNGAAFAMFAGWLRFGPASLWAAMRAVTAPTLVLWGDRDRLVSPRRADRTVRSLRAGRLLMLPGVGHIAQMEVPDVVACAVAGMWDAVDAGEWAGDVARDGKMRAAPRVEQVES